MKKVYIVGVEYNTGGFFDFFYSEEPRDTLYAKHKVDPALNGHGENCKLYKGEIEIPINLNEDDELSLVEAYLMEHDFENAFGFIRLS
jgi:hypothetical protein